MNKKPVSMKRIVLITLMVAGSVFGVWGQEYSGIGVALKQGTPCGSPVFGITHLKPGGPAELAGLKVGDCIAEVDDKIAYSITLDELVSMIRGEPLTLVKISVMRGAERMSFEVYRESIDGKHISAIAEKEWKDKHFSDLHQHYMKVYRGLDRLIFEAHRFFDNLIPDLEYFPFLETNTYRLNSKFALDYQIDGRVDFTPFGKLDFNGFIIPYLKDRDHPFSPLFITKMNVEALDEMISTHLSKGGSLWKVDRTQLKKNDTTYYYSWTIFKTDEKGKYHFSPKTIIELDGSGNNSSKITVHIEPPFTKKMEEELANAREDSYTKVRRDPRRNRGPFDAETPGAYCAKGNCINGESKLVINLSDKNHTSYTYDGNMKNGLPEGIGKLTIKKLGYGILPAIHSYYEGNFTRGFKNGVFNKTIYNSGKYAEEHIIVTYKMGEIEEELASEKKQPTILSKDSERGPYDFRKELSSRVKCHFGDCDNDEESSFTVNNPSGKKKYQYTGAMKDGLAHGKGILMIYDYRISKIKRYRGNFINGYREGKFEEDIMGMDPLTFTASISGKSITNEVVFAKDVAKSNENISGMLKPAPEEDVAYKPTPSQKTTFGSANTGSMSGSDQTVEKEYDLKTFPGVIEALKDYYYDRGWRYRGGNYLRSETSTHRFAPGYAGRVYVLVYKRKGGVIVYKKDGTKQKLPERNVLNFGLGLEYKFESKGFYLTEDFKEYSIGDFTFLEFPGRSKPIYFLFYRPFESPAFLMEFDKIY